MPMTYRFLKEELEAAILHGYNIVGDATTAALIPMFTGRTEMELPEVRQSEFDAGTVDEYPLVWKLFQQQGYTTLYAEDEPTVGTFNLRFNGFHKQPTDHYMRHFWQALWESDLRKDSQRYCTGNVPHHKFMLRYVEDFFLQYRNISRFAFGFHGELTHWDNNPADYLDADLANVLRRLRRNGVLEDTVLIIMGDHGARYSKVRYTVQGKLEERLPMMSFVFPEKFRKTYPHLWSNLKTNTERLSTPFDIYETLLDILNISRTRAKPNTFSRGISLLREIPVNRTCKQAGIGMHWCGCLHQVAVDTSETFVKPAAAELVSHINLLTTPLRDQCAELHLKTVHSVFLVMPNEQVLKYLRSKDSDQRVANFSKAADPDVVHYQVQIETEPCGGLFEATVMADFRSEEYQYSVTPGISRINMYGDQPKCIQNRHPSMRKFCCCRSFLNSTRDASKLP
ncbi:hypothetical protein BaRGS_00037107 [Batillaria attramentaria]|uniref:Uncharacterized protein n=1 Tax=Batillaria attramentaria TaxID=370345 RepID=A0ABD0J9X7_9CAEN